MIIEILFSVVIISNLIITIITNPTIGYKLSSLVRIFFKRKTTHPIDDYPSSIDHETYKQNFLKEERQELTLNVYKNLLIKHYPHNGATFSEAVDITNKILEAKKFQEDF